MKNSYYVTKDKRRWLVMRQDERHLPKGKRPYYYASDDLKQAEWAGRTYNSSPNKPEAWGTA